MKKDQIWDWVETILLCIALAEVIWLNVLMCNLDKELKELEVAINHIQTSVIELQETTDRVCNLIMESSLNLS